MAHFALQESSKLISRKIYVSDSKTIEYPHCVVLTQKSMKFTWNQFGNSRRVKIAVFAILGALNFVNWVQFSPQNVLKIHKNQNS